MRRSHAMTKPKLPYDEIGYWSEIKLEIIKDYAQAYSQILSSQRQTQFEHVYIDGFAGAGRHVSKASGELVPGSPMVALQIEPPFRHYYFVDHDAVKIEELERAAGQRTDVDVLHGDCNEKLLEEVFPRVRYEDFRRGLCLLDPYGLHLDWEVIQEAGRARSIEIFLNFPITDMNRNVLRRDPEGVSHEQASRMTRFWGDESWRDIAYSTQQGLFGDIQEKANMKVVAEAFRRRLKEAASFEHVPKPVLMRNRKRGPLYYLYFAAHKPVAAKIVREIFEKYRKRGKV